MRITLFFILLSFSSCKKNSYDKYSQMLNAIHDDIIECSPFVNPDLKITEDDKKFVVKSSEVKYLSTKYKLKTSSSKNAISYSIHLLEDVATIIITCDSSSENNFTSEPNTKLFNLKKLNGQWKLKKSIDMN